MNHKQLVVFWGAINLIALMLIFPPWRFYLDTKETKRYEQGPYCPIFVAPVVPGDSMDYGSRVKYHNGFPVALWRAEIDWVRLLMPIFVVALVASGLFVTLREKEPPTR